MDSTTCTMATLVAPPELRWTQGGKAVGTFRAAVNHRQQRDGKWVEEAAFVKVELWGSLAENVAACLDKGSRVIVTGRLKQNDYETKSGEKRSELVILADQVAPSLRWATAVVEKTPRKDA